MIQRVFIASIFASLLCGCSQEILVEGEMFNRVRTNIVFDAGSTIFVLDEQQNRQFQQLLQAQNEELAREFLSRSNQFHAQYGHKLERLLAIPTQTSSILKAYRQAVEDPRTDLEVMEYLVNKHGEDQIEQKFPREYAEYSVKPKTPLDFSDRFDLKKDKLKAFLTDCQQITTDSKGKFSVHLQAGRDYYLVSQSKALGMSWHYRFAPRQGEKVVLGPGNEHDD